MMRLIWSSQTVRKQGDDWKQVLTGFRSQDLLVPFQPEVLQFVQELSQRLIRKREYPQFVALGFWLRKANVARLYESWMARKGEAFVRPRGTVFHIAPSNVDTIFVYSWILSLLAGNRNIIRVSSKELPEKDELLSVLIEVLGEPEYSEVSLRTVILTYEHDDEMTAYLSSLCHTRVIWGGDETVQAIRRIPLSPLANELVFPDRFSFAVIRADAFLHADIELKRDLVHRFYNDVFWFAQMACSSPRILYWIGEEKEVALSQEKFWRLMDEVTEAQQPELAAAWQVQKMATSLFLASAEETGRIIRQTSYTRVSMDGIPEGARERHCGAGLIYECELPDLGKVASMIVDKDQTMSCFGFTKEELADFARQVSGRGIDRIVPIGQALNFDAVWDGQSFLQSFTREVVIL